MKCQHNGLAVGALSSNVIRHESRILVESSDSRRPSVAVTIGKGRSSSAVKRIA